MRRIFSALLIAVTCFALLAGCSNTANTPETTEQTVATEPAEEAGVLKVLTLGHSLAVDSGHMLALVANAEGYKEMKVGTLYHSGCRLSQHLKFMTDNAPEYSLYISSTETPNTPPKITEAVTMLQAVTFDYWDVIIMQDGAFEIGMDAKYKNGNREKIQAFVNENKLNPNAIFAWHMAWALPVNNDLRDTYPYPENNAYYTGYAKYNDDRSAFYNDITKCVSENIVPDETFKFIIPSGTAIENALSSYLEETDLHRDYAHATDLGRVIASYTWYCRLAGVEQLEEIKLDAIPVNFFKSTVGSTDRVLTDAEKDLILESVNNALAEPFKMTQSQYTTAPAQ